MVTSTVLAVYEIWQAGLKVTQEGVGRDFGGAQPTKDVIAEKIMYVVAGQCQASRRAEIQMLQYPEPQLVREVAYDLGAG